MFRAEDDIRSVDGFRAALETWGQVDAVLHMACLSNDPSSEIDAELTRSINLDAFEPLVIAAKEAGVRRFIYCSTSSVYGISDAPDVREDHPHVPLTLYNRYKSECEPRLMAHASPDFECVILRPSTVCGYSPRQRLDLVVNIFANQAFNAGKIVVLGGAQKRPNIHIDDLVDCYRLLLTVERGVAGEVFNVGAGNISVSDLAETTRAVVAAFKGAPVEVEVRGSVDPRSYQVNSDKIERVLGFRARRTIASAVRDLCAAFADGRIPEPLERDEYVNVRQMRRIFADLYKGAPPSELEPAAGVVSEIDMLRGAGK